VLTVAPFGAVRNEVRVVGKRLQPLQRTRAQRIRAPQVQEPPVQLQRRPRHTLLAVDGQVPVAGRLRQPGRLGRAESERWSGGRPGERYAAAVPTGLRAARAKEGRILTD